MTARRRRKSGSGPSATALIAWVGARQAAISAPMGAPVAVIQGGGQTARMARSRAVLVGRACGVAAGTLLACGSVLVSATHTGEGSLSGNSAPLPHRTPVALEPSNADEYRGDAPTERSATPPPELVSAQTVAESGQALHPSLGQVRRNNPDSVNAPIPPGRRSTNDQRPRVSPPAAARPAPRRPIARVAPVLAPATQQVGRVAPVGRVLAPTNPSGKQTGSLSDPPPVSPRAAQPRYATGDAVTGSPVTSDVVASVRQVAEPVSNSVGPAAEPVVESVVQPARPAMAMLTSILPKG